MENGLKKSPLKIDRTVFALVKMEKVDLDPHFAFLTTLTRLISLSKALLLPLAALSK